eukprot:6199104-Pleurochrysis_carterae.AAC.2
MHPVWRRTSQVVNSAMHALSIGRLARSIDVPIALVHSAPSKRVAAVRCMHAASSKTPQVRRTQYDDRSGRCWLAWRASYSDVSKYILLWLRAW